MSPLFETIKIKNGSLQNIEYHNRRINKSIKELFGEGKEIRLEEQIVVPPECTDGIYKCNVLYDKFIKEIRLAPYTIKNIKRLKLIECNTINYSYKYSDRTKFNELIKNANCGDDEEILIIKEELVTDTSYTNVAFYDGKKWITPSKPLLAGTKRAKLIDDGLIVAGDIQPDDFKKFSRIKLFNAMLDFDECPTLPIDSIVL